MHEPSITAWLMLGCYLAGAAAAVRAGRIGPPRDQYFWFGTAVLLAVLGLAKHFKLVDLATGIGRSLAHGEGWYDYRRLAQAAFVLVVAIVVVSAAGTLRGWFARASSPKRSAAVGLVLLFVFILVRGVSIHIVDKVVMAQVAGMRFGWWLELAAIAVIAVSAVRVRPEQQSR
ncbi:MAG: hypothetical protein HOP96_08675 [Sphingomonas sp.]|nr:hypothetical protein [Sphingomonas sp.]